MSAQAGSAGMSACQGTLPFVLPCAVQQAQPQQQLQPRQAKAEAFAHAGAAAGSGAAVPVAFAGVVVPAVQTSTAVVPVVCSPAVLPTAVATPAAIPMASAASAPAQQASNVARAVTFTGTVTSLNIVTGYGFIHCPEISSQYNKDVFVHRQAAHMLKLGDKVEFNIVLEPNGPRARNLMVKSTRRASAPNATPTAGTAPTVRQRRGGGQNNAPAAGGNRSGRAARGANSGSADRQQPPQDCDIHGAAGTGCQGRAERPQQGGRDSRREGGSARRGRQSRNATESDSKVVGPVTDARDGLGALNFCQATPIFETVLPPPEDYESGAADDIAAVIDLFEATATARHSQGAAAAAQA
eukprot:TRINITY_DN2563_c0_g2_i1.p1 TRINITY_DN2563_c0_g2~~TRINITY_DN2563_c0_g2_i1.p1  ORF type:complete len:355 (+),score=44.79 TRINITY_DN2563_c0_g2_i1:113-1177(+)